MTLPFEVKPIYPDYKSMTDLGKLFGVSSHIIGRWLTRIGLRTPHGNPSRTARDQGMIRAIPNGRNDDKYHIWHTEKTVAALEKAGHKRGKRSAAAAK